jgi:hypothetical protein
MKEMNLPETQLRSWQPRRPSAGLKRRIFSAQPGTPPTAVTLLGWLAPVTACAVLTLLVFNPASSLPGSSAGRGAVMAMVLSNQNYAAYASDGSQNVQNRLASATFDWTNRGSSTPSIRFTPFIKPND